MARDRTLERCREEIARGDLWKARDRLQGLFVTCYFDAEVADLLADVHWRMGDLPQAGKFWMLVERDDERARAARAAFEARFPDPVGRANQLPIRRRGGEFPPAVRARLATLAERTGLTGVPDSEPRATHDADEKSFKSAVIHLGCLFLLAVLAGLVLIAMWPAIRWALGGARDGR